LAEDSEASRQARSRWAAGHDWSYRARQIGEAIDAAIPYVVAFVLSKEGHSVEVALDGLRRDADYPRLDLRFTRCGDIDKSKDFGDAVPSIGALLNSALAEEGGDYIVVLAADAPVGRGWVRALVRPLLMNAEVSMAFVGVATGDTASGGDTIAAKAGHPSTITDARLDAWLSCPVDSKTGFALRRTFAAELLRRRPVAGPAMSSEQSEIRVLVIDQHVLEAEASYSKSHFGERAHMSRISRRDTGSSVRFP
jgi:hypothetical protein